MKTRIAIALLTLAAKVVAQQITLTAPTVKAGGVTTITVTLSGASANQPAALQWFMPSLPGMVASSGPAAIAAGKSIVCADKDNQFRCILSGINTNLLADGVIATVTVPVPNVPFNMPLTSLLGVNLAGTVEIPITSGPPLVLTQLSPCDVNNDGRTDLLDIRNVIDQIEGVIPASTDLNLDGRVSLIDLQRVVNAVFEGGSCYVGLAASGTSARGLIKL